jgi:hypothetical protein
MSKREKIPRYRQKFGTSQPEYKHKRCAHANGHTDHVDGYTFDVCDVCNIVRKNLGKRPSKTFPALAKAS